MSDLISRQAAIEAIDGLVSTMSVCVSTDECRGMNWMKKRAMKAIEELPSEQKRIPVIRCSECIKGRTLKNTLVKCVDDGRIHGEEYYCGAARPKDETKGRWCWNDGWEWVSDE